FRRQKRLPHDRTRLLAGEVAFKCAAVDGNHALAVPQENSGHSSLAPARSKMLYERQFRESPSTTPPARRASVPRADASDRRRPAVCDTSASPTSTWGACPA